MYKPVIVIQVTLIPANFMICLRNHANRNKIVQLRLSQIYFQKNVINA